MGDFNIDLLCSSNVPKRWQNIYTSYGLSQIIEQPTRVTEKSATLVDHIYVSRINFVQECQVIKMSISDHFGIGLRWKPGNICNQNSSHNTISYKNLNRLILQI